MLRRRRPPTDYELLRAIYEHHRSDFAHSADSRATAIFVPLDVPAIADELRVDPNSVVGRLYHHLDPIYAQEPDPTVGRTGRKSFFSLRVGDDANCVNFPLLEAVLAGLWQQRSRELLANSRTCPRDTPSTARLRASSVSTSVPASIASAIAAANSSSRSASS
jgi:hypothetical protein